MENNRSSVLGKVITIIVIAVLVFGLVIPGASILIESSREANDLHNIESAYEKVKNACSLDTGTDPRMYRNSGPYVKPSDNEKHLGLTEVLRTVSGGVRTYTMYVEITQQKPLWQGRDGIIDDTVIPSEGIGSGASLYRIYMTSEMSSPVIVLDAFEGSLKAQYI